MTDRGVSRGAPNRRPAADLAVFPAVVVFSGASSLKWSRLLRAGFSHCFVAIARDGDWIVCDPLLHRTELVVVAGLNAHDLAAWYQKHGLTALVTSTRRAPFRMAPIRPFTCVEAVKRILGIHAPFVLTPWQLYRHLITES